MSVKFINNSNSGGGMLKHIFDHQGPVKSFIEQRNIRGITIFH